MKLACLGKSIRGLAGCVVKLGVGMAGQSLRLTSTLLASLPARCLGISGLSSNLASQVFVGKKSVAQLPSRTSTHFGFTLSL